MTHDLTALARWRAELEDPNFDFGRWEGGNTLADGVIQAPYFDYNERALELIGAMPVEVFDWQTWLRTDEAKALLADHQRLADATPEQIVKLCTALRRGDRFSEGTLAWAFESGLLLAIVQRADVITG